MTVKPVSAITRHLSLALILALLVSSLGIVAAPGRAPVAHAAGTAGIPLFNAPFAKNVSAGGVQKVWVHTIALADVQLKVSYGNGQEFTLQGRSDEAGIHQFVWMVAYTGNAARLARYWVYVTRGPLHSSARGYFNVFPAPPLHLGIDVLTPSLRSGDTLRLRIHGRPNAALTLHVRAGNGADLFTRTTTLDSSGTWLVSVAISSTATTAQHLNIVVDGAFYSRHEQVTGSAILGPAVTTQGSGNGAPVPPSASLAEARARARAAAGGSLALAQSNAQNEVQQISVDLDVLGQFSSGDVPHGADYYKALLARAVSYDDYIEVTAQASVDDATVEGRMRAVMPHKAIMVSIGEQALRAYQDGKMVMFTYVTTGRPELPTVTGHFHIYAKITPYEFISPWPKGSPFYYEPTWIKYWMPFYSGYGLHDAWWRAHYGPGTNIGGDGPYSSEPTGTHGCVNIPFQNTLWLWNWAPVGTPVVVYGGPPVKPGVAGI